MAFYNYIGAHFLLVFCVRYYLTCKIAPYKNCLTFWEWKETIAEECPDWKAELLVQPVFCIVDTGSCSFYLLTSTWHSRWQTHQTQADQTCGGNGNILTKLTTTNSLSLIISHKRSSSDHPRSRLACLRRGPSQLKPAHRCSWRSPSCSGWCLDWSRESRFHKMA